MNNYKDLAQMLHEWYLEATKMIDPKNYNQEAAVPWDKLTDEQKFIDRYIAGKLQDTLGVKRG